MCTLNQPESNAAIRVLPHNVSASMASSVRKDNLLLLLLYQAQQPGCTIDEGAQVFNTGAPKFFYEPHGPEICLLILIPKPIYRRQALSIKQQFRCLVTGELLSSGKYKGILQNFEVTLSTFF